MANYVPTIGDYPGDRLTREQTLCLFFIWQHPRAETGTLTTLLHSDAQPIVNRLNSLSLITMDEGIGVSTEKENFTWNLSERGAVHIANLIDLVLPKPRIVWCTLAELAAIEKENPSGK